MTNPTRKKTIIDACANPTPPILQVTGLSFRTPECALFTGFSTQIPPGVTLVCGGEGSGKTTLLRLLAGELRAEAGELEINGISLRTQPDIYRQQIFWIDPRSDAFDQMTAKDYFISLPANYPDFDPEVLAAAIEGLCLVPHLDKQLYMLSTGSKRKVWLAAASASGAPAMFLDQPFAALDVESRRFASTLLEHAAGQTSRAWMIADYEPPENVALAAVIDLGD